MHKEAMCMKHRALRTILALGMVLAFAGAAKGAGYESFSYGDLQKLLAASKGKVVVINFFATWCPPCREEVPGLVNIRKHYGEDALVLIGASLDEGDAELRSFAAKEKINYPVKKAGMDLVSAAGVSGIPHMLIFDGKGEVAANEAGFVPEAALRAFLEKIMKAG